MVAIVVRAPVVDSTVAAAVSPQRRSRPIAVAVGVLLAALIALTHFDVVFLGRTFVLSNHFNSMDYRPLVDNYGEDFIPPQVWSERNLVPYPNVRDPGATWWQWEPALRFLRAAMERLEWPLWNPYVGGGVPSYPNLVDSTFFPPSVLLVALGLSPAVQDAYFLVLLWAGAWFTFLFLRRHGLPTAASLTGAILVAMSGAFNQLLGTFIFQPVACLPVALYATRAFLDRPDGRRAALLAAVYAAMALASFPPVLAGVFLVVTIYGLAGIWFERGAGRSRGVLQWWLAAVTLSLGLVAFYYLPVFALRAAVSHVAAQYEALHAGLDTMPVVNALQLLSPTIMDGVAVYVAGPFVLGGPALPYIGVTAACLVVLARLPLDVRERTLLFASVVSAALIGLKLFGVPPVQWLGSAPLLAQFHFAYYFGLALDFPLIFLASIGMARIVRGAVSPVAAAGAVAVVLGAHAWVRHVASLHGAFAVPGHESWARDWMFLAAISATAVIVIGATAIRRLRATTAVLALVALAVGEGLFNNSYPNPRRDDVYAHPPDYIGVLQRNAVLERVFTVGAPPANINAAFEIETLDSLMPFNPTRMYELYRKYTATSHTIFMSDAKQLPPEPLLDRANVSVLSIRNAYPSIVNEALGRKCELLLTDEYVTVCRRHTLPRYRFSSDYLVLDAAEAIDAVAQLPSRTVILEQQPGFPSLPDAAATPAVGIVAQHRNGATLDVEAPRAGLLYISQSLLPGWRAWVNGIEQPMLAANYAFAAIELPAGHARVELSYSPPGITAGIAVSVGSALVLAVLLFRARRTTVDA